MRCTTELHGGDYRPISTPHRSGIKMKKRWADCVKEDLREGTVRRGGVRLSCMEATIVPHRPHIKVG